MQEKTTLFAIKKQILAYCKTIESIFPVHFNLVIEKTENQQYQQLFSSSSKKEIAKNLIFASIPNKNKQKLIWHFTFEQQFCYLVSTDTENNHIESVNNLISSYLEAVLNSKATNDNEIEFTQNDELLEILKENYRKINTILSNITGVVYRCKNDYDWTMEYLSQGVYELTGYKPEEIINNAKIKWNDIIDKDYQQSIWDQVQAALQKKEMYRLLFPIYAKNNEQKWIYEQGQGIFDEEGNLICLEGYLSDVTELKKAEKQLTEKNALLNAIIKNIPYDFWVRDKEGNVIYQSDESKKNWGDLINNKNTEKSLPKEITDIWKKNNEKAFKGEVVKGKVEYILKNKKHHFQQIIAPIVSKNNSIDGILGFNIDFTERQNIQKALIESEIRYREIFENAAIGIFKSNISGGFIDVNNALAEMFGYESPKDMINSITNIEKQIYKDHTFRRKMIENLSLLERSFKFETEFIRKNGSTFTGRITARVIRDDNNIPLFLEGFIEDVSERKRMMDAIKQSEERFRQLSENIEEIFWIAEKDQIVYINPAFKKYWNYTLQELNADKQLKLRNIHPDDKDIFLEAFQHSSYQTEGRMNIEFRIISSTNQTHWLWVRTFPVFDEYGKIVRTIGVANDITEIKVAEETLKTLNETLELKVKQRTDELLKINKELQNEIQVRIEAENKIVQLLGETQAKTNALEAQEEELVQSMEELQTAYEQIESLNRKNQESAHFYEQILDAIPYPISVTDNEKKWTFINHAGEKLLKKNRKQLIGKNCNFWGDECNQETCLLNSIKKNEILTYEKHYNGLDFKIQYFPLKTSTGKANGFINFIQDVTEQNKAQKELQESENKFSTVFKLSPNPMILMKMEGGVFIDVNEAFLAHSKFKREEVIGKSYAETKVLNFEKDKEKIVEAFQFGKTVEVPFRKANGEIFIGLLSARMINFNNNNYFLCLIVDIDQRIKLENEIRVSKQSFQNVFNSVHDAIFIHTIDGDIIEYNQKVLDLFQLEPEEVKKLSIFDSFWSKNSRINIIEGLWKLVISGKSQLIEWQAQRPHDGYEFWVEIFMRKVIYQNNEVILTSIRDITDRKMAEQIIKQNQDNLESLFHSLHDFLFVINENFQFVETNTHAILTLSYAVPELRQTKVGNIIITQDGTPINNILKECLQGKLTNFLAFLQPKNFYKIEVEINVSKGIWNNEKVIFLTCRDITYRKKIESNLRESEEKFKKLAQSARDGVVLLNHNGELIFWNIAMEKMLCENNSAEFNKEYLIKEIHRCFEDLPISAKLIAVESEENIYETDLLLPNGNKLPVEISLSGFHANEQWHAVGIVRDISKRKEAEYNIQKALEKERELNLLKSHFVSTVSHEFRTPLTIIFSNTELIEKTLKKPVDKLIDRSLTRIFSALKNMSSMLDDISFINRDESGNLSFNPEVVEFELFIEGIIEEIFTVFNREVQINVSYYNRVGFILIDKKLIRHIFINLLSNAIKYSDSDKRVDLEIEILFPRSIKKRKLQLKVIDQGMGMNKDDLANIFTPFHRGANVSHIKGTGLGMSIVKRCVDLHHGTIDIESKINKGTTVTVQIPIVKWIKQTDN